MIRLFLMVHFYTLPLYITWWVNFLGRRKQSIVTINMRWFFNTLVAVEAFDDAVRLFLWLRIHDLIMTFLMVIFRLWLHIEPDLWISLEEEAIKGNKEGVILYLHSCRCRGVLQCSVVILMIYDYRSDYALSITDYLC